MNIIETPISGLYDAQFQSEDTSDFLGMCFGSKRCKRRRKRRQKRREERHRAKMLTKSAQAAGIESGTYKGSGNGVLDAIGGIVGGIFGGGGGGSAEQPYIDNQPAQQNPQIVSAAPSAKKDYTKLIIIVVAVFLIAGFGFFALKSKK